MVMGNGTWKLLEPLERFLFRKEIQQGLMVSPARPNAIFE